MTDAKLPERLSPHEVTSHYPSPEVEPHGPTRQGLKWLIEEEIARRWNAHAGLVKALEGIDGFASAIAARGHASQYVSKMGDMAREAVEAAKESA